MTRPDDFDKLIGAVRPELHRYCARMTGSVFDGEDVVQDALAKAHSALAQMTDQSKLKPWLFRIAHNAALDFLRRYESKNVDVVAEVPEPAPSEDDAIDPALIEAALAVFVELPPVQRSAFILKDVLGHSLDDVATTLGTSVGAVKAALSRARANVAPTLSPQPRRVPSADELALLQRYASLFNAHDWDGLRALLSAEARLDLVSRVQQRATEARYYDNYASVIAREALSAQVGDVDGVAAIAIFRPTSTQPAYFILLESDGGQVSLIRDFRYVPYIAQDARFSRRFASSPKNEE